MSRLVIETPCDHDEVEPHVRRHAKQRVDLIDLNGDPLPPEWIYTDLPCPGGSRTVLTEPSDGKFTFEELEEALCEWIDPMSLPGSGSREDAGDLLAHVAGKYAALFGPEK